MTILGPTHTDKKKYPTSYDVTSRRRDRPADEHTIVAVHKQKKQKLPSETGRKNNKPCKSSDKPASRPIFPTREAKPRPRPVFCHRKDIHIRKPSWHANTNVSQEEERAAPDQVTAEPETTPPCPGESETAQAVVAQDEPKTTPPAEPETVQAVVTLDEPETANIRKDAEQEDEPIYKLTAKQTDAMLRTFYAADLSPLPHCTSRSNKIRSKSDHGSVVLTSNKVFRHKCQENK